MLEFIDGQPLSGRLETGPLEEAEVVLLAGDVAAALAAAHRAGLVHRDIKPANVIVTEPGQARLIDFGLAAAGAAPVSTDVFVGTFDYCAPEQTGMLARPVDGRTDLYALGVVMYECATGELPFQAEDVGELLAMHATVRARDPRQLRADLSPPLAELILRLLAKDPDDRVQTAQELCAELGRLNGRAGPVSDTATAHLVGRDNELAALRNRWRQARTGAGGTALLYGPAGTGKTSLATELAGIARADGALVLSGRCDPASALPLAPLRAAIDGYLRTVAGLLPVQRDTVVAALRDAAGLGAGLLRPLSSALAVLLGTPDLTAEERHEQFAAAVAAFLAALATQQGGLLLVLDDVQWLDAASRAVLRRLDEESEAPVLVVATAGDGDDDALALFAETAGERLDLRLSIGPLDEDGTVQLVSAYLSGAAVSAEVTAELSARGPGNPFTLLEYLHALVDAGALRPSWGTWRLDADRLQAVDLPGDVFDLVLGRINGLAGQVREILTVAAALGSRFDVATLSEVIGGDATAALTEAVHGGVLHLGVDGYSFVHDRVRESLLAAVDAVGRRRLHQRIAVALDAQGGTEPADVYALAHHYANGEVDRTPERVIAAGRAAGLLALDENAPAAAVSFLTAAATAAAAAGIALDSRFRESLAVAYLATGQAEAARDQLEPALEDETDPTRRAALRLQLATVARVRWELNRALEHVRAGLAELGRPLPRHPALLGLMTLGLLLRWLVTGDRRPASRPATGKVAQRLRLETQLCGMGAAAAAMGLQGALMPIFTLRPARAGSLLGAGPEYAMTHSATGMLAGFLRLRRRRDGVFRRTAAIAAQLRDPALSAMVAWLESFGRLMSGECPVAEAVEVAETHRRWLEADYYSNMLLIRTHDLTARGYAEEALDWHGRGRARISDSTAEAFTVYALAEAAARSLLGQTPELSRPRSWVPTTGADAGYWMQYLPTAVRAAVEQDELGAPFEEAVAAFQHLGLRGPRCRVPTG